MPYYGYIEVEVRDMRSNGNPDAAEMVAGERRIVRVEDHVADLLVDGATSNVNEEVGKMSGDVRRAIVEVRSAVQREDLRERWTVATQRMSAQQMRAALEVLEADE